MMLVELRCQLGAMDVLGDAKGRGDVGGVNVLGASLERQLAAMDVLGDAKGRGDVGGVKVPAWRDGCVE